MTDANTTETVKTAPVSGKNGQSKCPSCGSTDIKQNPKTGKLRCNFCRHEFDGVNTSSINDDIKTLVGEEIGAASININKDATNLVTLKCESCGAEVVIDTTDSVQSRCHWCRNTLSLNQRLENGAVPDAILPFSITREKAQVQINAFVNSRKFFAHPKFTKEFTTENILGVYFPYMTIDINASAHFKGEGEITTRRYRVKRGDHYITKYDFERYRIVRDFDIQINDLTVESNTERLDNTNQERTNNVINAIMPFDVKNSIDWDANFLRGFTSEKRDVNIDDLRTLVGNRGQDIAKHASNVAGTNYDRGIRYDEAKVDVHGQRWNSVFLPVWVYSYFQKDANITHYVAVNGQTNKIMGSVPIHMPKLILMSILVEIIGFLIAFLCFIFLDDDGELSVLFLFSGIFFFATIYHRYRNADARFEYESSTETNIENMQKEDELVGKEHGVSNSHMNNANDQVQLGVTIDHSLLDSFDDFHI